MALLTVKNLHKSYGKVTAVNRISFDIAEGRCVALLGPNGAGKTTTLLMLSGLLTPTDGTIRFSGMGVGDLRRYIGYLPQYPAFYNWMSGEEFLKFVGKLAQIQAAQLRQRTTELLELVGLKDAGKRRIGGYSGGMKQRLGLAQALIHRPKLLMLDEPVSALDPLGRREVLDMLRLIKLETTVLFSTHVLHDAEEISDDVLIMRGGEIIISGSLEQIRREHQQPLIIVQAEQPLERWAERLRGQAFINEVTCSGTQAKIIVNDLAAAKQHILNDLVARQIPLSKFEVAQSSLEDLFMKVVQA